MVSNLGNLTQKLPFNIRNGIVQDKRKQKAPKVFLLQTKRILDVSYFYVPVLIKPYYLYTALYIVLEISVWNKKMVWCYFWAHSQSKHWFVLFQGFIFKQVVIFLEAYNSQKYKISTRVLSDRVGGLRSITRFNWRTIHVNAFLWLAETRLRGQMAHKMNGSISDMRLLRIS